MKNRILVSVLAGVFLVISACGEQEPTSAPTELGPSLHTAPVDFLARGGCEPPLRKSGLYERGRRHPGV